MYMSLIVLLSILTITNVIHIKKLRQRIDEQQYKLDNACKWIDKQRNKGNI